MGWWKRFKVWLKEDPYESPLKDWEPGKLIWLPVETIEGEPPERLEHADVLPDSTFRVFPTRADNRNGYDSEASVDRAVSARMRRPYDYDSPGGAREPIRVYRAETVWRDVTEEFVK